MPAKRTPATTTNRAPSADATQEYRGPIVEVVTDVTVELVPEERPVVLRAPQPVQMLAPKATSIAPVAVSPRPSSAPPRPPPPRRSPDASLEFPHPVSPELFADSSGEMGEMGEMVPDFDDELPPPKRDTTRVRYVAFTGVMVVAGILLGLAIGSRSHASVTDADSTAAKPSTTIARKPASLSTPTTATDTTQTAAASPATATPTTGTIVSPKWAKGRRVYMDGGKDFGPAGSVDVACGTHVVQIGTTGKPRKVNVPCGGQVNVLP